MPLAEPTLGVLMLEGKMAQVPGCMACPETFPYPVIRRVVKGATTPRSQADAEALLPLYVDAARALEEEGVHVITANCGLIALLQERLAAAVRVPVVTSALLLVPALHRMLGAGAALGILTFFPEAIGEKNYRASGWSGDDIPVVVGGVSAFSSWTRFLETKELDDALFADLLDDLADTVHEMREAIPRVGAIVSECTMLPAVFSELRRQVDVPIYDILSALDWAMSGYLRGANRPVGVA